MDTEILTISEQEVELFKSKFCDENEIIIKILRESFAPGLDEPILDVGAGMGDISYQALAEKRVIQLDPMDYSHCRLRRNHSRQRVGFFDYVAPPKQRIGTLMFCHSLQFVDYYPERLQAKITELSPASILTVVNANDGDFGKALNWLKGNEISMNPENGVQGFPPKVFSVKQEQPFVATLKCKNFAQLAMQLLYVFDADRSGRTRVVFEAFLRNELASPQLQINQSITLYKRNEK
jgi:hypothetical protein